MQLDDSLIPPNFANIYGQSSLKHIKSDASFAKIILITGAQGMIGHGIAITIKRWFESKNIYDFKVILSSRQWSVTASSFWKDTPNFTLINNDQIAIIEHPIDLVIHTASPSNITQISTFEDLEWANLGILRGLLQLRPRKVVYISSGEVYGGGKTNEDRVLKGFSTNQKRDWYPIAKLATENELQLFQRTQELEICVVRLFHTFGPGVKKGDGRSFADVLWGAALRNEIILKSNGEQVRTFLYLSDALEGIMLLAFNKHPAFTLVNLGSDTPNSILEFAKVASSITGAKIVFESSKTFQHSPNKTIIPDLERLSSTGWSRKLTVEDGIRRTINWIRSSTRVQM
jgi:nucleoside-diphosphate-sugar epimerase